MQVCLSEESPKFQMGCDCKQVYVNKIVVFTVAKKFHVLVFAPFIGFVSRENIRFKKYACCKQFY